MKQFRILFILLIFSASVVKGQKVFTMGNQKMKMEVAANQAELIWHKDKKTYIICPENQASGSKRGKRSLIIIDGKGKSESIKNILIDNDEGKPHLIEKVMLINSKVYCLHSFYNKADKKYMLFQTTLADVDGQPEGLGREILSIDTKNPDVIEGIDVVFSNDSSKMVVLVYENTGTGKNEKLALHCLIVDKEDFAFERDLIFNIEIPNKGLIRAKVAVSNQATIYVAAELLSKKSNVWTSTMNIYYRDNEDNQQEMEFPKGDMKNISNLDCRFDRKEHLVIAGIYSNKSNIDYMSGGFIYILNIAKNEFIATTVFDNDDDMSGSIRKLQPAAYAKDLFRPAKFSLYIDQSNHYFLVGQQYKDLKYYNDEQKSELFYQPEVRAEYSNMMIICGDGKGNVLWQKAMIGGVMYNIWEANRLNIIVQDDRELKLMTISVDKQIKFSKGAAPTEPDHKLDARSMQYMGNGKICAVGHAMTGSGGFYIDYLDLNTIDLKGKIEVEKKKKK